MISTKKDADVSIIEIHRTEASSRALIKLGVTVKAMLAFEAI